MATYTVTQLRHRISELIARVQYRGESLTITRQGLPVARIVPIDPPGTFPGRPIPTQRTEEGGQNPTA